MTIVDCAHDIMSNGSASTSAVAGSSGDQAVTSAVTLSIGAYVGANEGASVSGSGVIFIIASASSGGASGAGGGIFSAALASGGGTDGTVFGAALGSDPQVCAGLWWWRHQQRKLGCCPVWPWWGHHMWCYLFGNINQTYTGAIASGGVPPQHHFCKVMLVLRQWTCLLANRNMLLLPRPC